MEVGVQFENHYRLKVLEYGQVAVDGRLCHRSVGRNHSSIFKMPTSHQNPIVNRFLMALVQWCCGLCSFFWVLDAYEALRGLRGVQYDLINQSLNQLPLANQVNFWLWAEHQKT